MDFQGFFSTVQSLQRQRHEPRHYLFIYAKTIRFLSHAIMSFEQMTSDATGHSHICYQTIYRLTQWVQYIISSQEDCRNNAGKVSSWGLGLVLKEPQGQLTVLCLRFQVLGSCPWLWPGALNFPGCIFALLH